MSYRLINANALAANCKQVNDMPCIYADLPNGLDGGYYNLTRGNADKSRYHELFGTPERAAETLSKIVCGDCANIGECPLLGCDCSYSPDTYLEWLEQEAD